MDYIPKECAMCKKIIDNSSNYITISNKDYFYNECYKPYTYFHRFCYFNYRTQILK
jgi:hypothetical protein